MKINWNYVKEPEFLAQAGHFMLGSLSTLWPYVFWHSSWKAALIGTAATAIYMGIKEFAYDIYLEKETVAIGWKDILFYSIGLAFGWSSILL